MSETKDNKLRALLENGMVKYLLLPALAAVGGFLGHAVVEVPGLSKQVEQHTTQLQNLWTGQAETHKALQDVAVAVTRVDGKLDVVNQKLDDAVVTARSNDTAARVARHSKPSPTASADAPAVHQP